MGRWLEQRLGTNWYLCEHHKMWCASKIGICSSISRTPLAFIALFLSCRLQLLALIDLHWKVPLLLIVFVRLSQWVKVSVVGLRWSSSVIISLDCCHYWERWWSVALVSLHQWVTAPAVSHRWPSSLIGSYCDTLPVGVTGRYLISWLTLLDFTSILPSTTAGLHWPSSAANSVCHSPS